MGCPLFFRVVVSCLSLAVRCATRVAGQSRLGLFRRRVRACQGRVRRFACQPLMHTRTKATSLCTLYQAERRVFMDWEASEETQTPPPALPPRAARVALCLIAARRSPSVLVLRYKQSLSIPKLSARCSLQALQGTTKKQNTCCRAPQQNATAVHPAVRPRVANNHHSE